MSKLERDIVGMLAIKARDLLAGAIAGNLPEEYEDWKQRVDRWLEDFVLVETAIENRAAASDDAEVCRTCKFWESSCEEDTHVPTESLCRWRPPQKDDWPITTRDDWCGEYQKLETTT